MIDDMLQNEKNQLQQSFGGKISSLNGVITSLKDRNQKDRLRYQEKISSEKKRIKKTIESKVRKNLEKIMKKELADKVRIQRKELEAKWVKKENSNEDEYSKLWDYAEEVEKDRDKSKKLISTLQKELENSRKSQEKTIKNLVKIHRSENERFNRLLKQQANTIKKLQASNQSLEKTFKKQLVSREKENKKLIISQIKKEKLFREEIKDAVSLAERNSREMGIQEGVIRSKKQMDSLEREISRLIVERDKLQAAVVGISPGPDGEKKVLMSLQKEFKKDNVSLIKSRKGSDIIHEIVYGGGVIGSIIIEVKNTGRWSSQYLAQALRYRDEYECSSVLIVTKTYRKGQKMPTIIKGIPIVSFDNVEFVVHQIREKIIALYKQESSQKGRLQRNALLVDYITSDEFHLKISTFDEIMDTLQVNLQEEISKHEKWHELRSKGLRKAVRVISGLNNNLLDACEKPIPRIGENAKPVAVTY